MSGAGIGGSSRERQTSQNAISFSTKVRTEEGKGGSSSYGKKEATEKPTLRRKIPNGEKRCNLKFVSGLAGVAQRVERHPTHQEVTVGFLVRGHAQVAGWIPSRGCAGGSYSMFLSH